MVIFMVQHGHEICQEMLSYPPTTTSLEIDAVTFLKTIEANPHEITLVRLGR